MCIFFCEAYEPDPTLNIPLPIYIRLSTIHFHPLSDLVPHPLSDWAPQLLFLLLFIADIALFFLFFLLI